MPPPTEAASRRRTTRRNPGSRKDTSPRPAQPDVESLFVGQDEADARWDPTDYDQEEETLGWDASVEHDTATFPTFRDSDSFSRNNTAEDNEVLPPTQRVSQIKGLW